MKRYYINKVEITESEAKSIEKKNNEIMQRGDFNEMINIQFIVVI